MELYWKKFNAMGTEVIIAALLSPQQAHFLDDAERVVLDFEKRFSRFIPGNELHELNDHAGGAIVVSDEMAEMLTDIKKLHNETNGVFDPTIIGSLERVGYNKTFVEIDNAVGQQEGEIEIDEERISHDFLARPNITEMELAGRTVKAPHGFRVDLGGIGKGYLADLLGRTIFANVESYWISMGGDLLMSGNDLGKEGWITGIQDPIHPEAEAFSLKTRGEKLGIATSGILKRKGKRGNFEWTHLIDPRSGLPVKNDVVAVTVIASTAERADVFAKTVLILGKEQGVRFIEGTKDSVCIIFFKDSKAPMFSKGALRYF